MCVAAHTVGRGVGGGRLRCDTGPKLGPSHWVAAHMRVLLIFAPILEATSAQFLANIRKLPVALTSTGVIYTSSKMDHFWHKDFEQGSKSFKKPFVVLCWLAWSQKLR